MFVCFKSLFLSIHITRDIYFAKYYDKGGGKWVAGEKNENKLGKKIKKEKEEEGGKIT